MSEATPDAAPTDSPAFKAGAIAVERGWHDACLALQEDLDDLAPFGPPLVVVMPSEDLNVHRARSLAAVAGAGRSILLIVSDGEIENTARQWLGQQVEIVNLHGGSDDAEATVSTETPSETPPIVPPELPPLGGDYCKLAWGNTKASAGSSPEMRRYLDRLISDLRLKGVRDGLCYAAHMPTSPSGIACWIEFSLAGRGGQEFMVIETPIGAGRDPSALWTSQVLSTFAWHVVRWCEQPSAEIAGTRRRWFRRASQTPTPPVPASLCFPGSIRTPLRNLSTSESLVAFRHEPAFGQEPIDLATQTPMFFEYWIPLEKWDVFRTWAITAVTSLLRMLHLLQDPTWNDLPGRNPVTESAAVEQLKSSLGFTSYGDLAVQAFNERYKRVRSMSIALGDGSMSEAEFDALDLVERPLSPGPPITIWPPR